MTCLRPFLRVVLDLAVPVVRLLAFLLVCFLAWGLVALLLVCLACLLAGAWVHPAWAWVLACRPAFLLVRPRALLGRAREWTR